MVQGVWNILFVRNFGAAEEKDWRDLKDLIQGVSLNNEKDETVWDLENLKHFSVKSLYRHISFGGVVDMRLKKIWASRIPLKVKFFLWQLYLNRLPTTDQMALRHWKGDRKSVV